MTIKRGRIFAWLIAIGAAAVLVTLALFNLSKAARDASPKSGVTLSSAATSASASPTQTDPGPQPDLPQQPGPEVPAPQQTIVYTDPVPVEYDDDLYDTDNDPDDGVDD